MTSEAAILFDKSIIAKPLNAPEVASIHIKNTECYYRWVNFKHSNGSRYAMHKAMGFTNATNEDVDLLVGDEAVCTDTELRSGDVILMKIPFHEWAAHAKKNMQTAQTLQAMRGVYNTEEELSGDVFAEHGNRRMATAGNLASVKQAIRGKLTPFMPDNPDAIIEGVNASDADKVREQVEEIREDIRKGKPVRPAPKE